MRIRGKVVDKDSGRGVEYAVVKLLSNGRTVDREVTDSSGRFTVEAPIERGTVKATATHYTSDQKTVTKSGRVILRIRKMVP